jgi:hypothetical protein
MRGPARSRTASADEPPATNSQPPTNNVWTGRAAQSGQVAAAMAIDLIARTVTGEIPVRNSRDGSTGGRRSPRSLRNRSSSAYGPFNWMPHLRTRARQRLRPAARLLGVHGMPREAEAGGGARRRVAPDEALRRAHQALAAASVDITSLTPSRRRRLARQLRSIIGALPASDGPNRTVVRELTSLADGSRSGNERRHRSGSGGTAGGGAGNRTPGLNSAIVALYQLSYTPAGEEPA